MSQLELKKSILDIVNNQIKDNNPPCTKEMFMKLQEAGYSKSESKDKILSVLLETISDMLSTNQMFDEKKYKKELEKMYQQCIDFEDDHHFETEWDEWYHYVMRGYELSERGKSEKALLVWDKAWDLFQTIIKQQPKRVSIDDLMATLDYEYPIDMWTLDYQEEMHNANKYDENIAYCQTLLDMLDWNRGDNEWIFKSVIADTLFLLGKNDESFKLYESWLTDDPNNYSLINCYCDNLRTSGKLEKAYEIIKNVIYGKTCYEDNEVLFIKANILANALGKNEESQWFQKQIEQFDKAREEMFNKNINTFFEFNEQKKQPIIKAKKISRNAPCPCGSGKKYKKCCGK